MTLNGGFEAGLQLASGSMMTTHACMVVVAHEGKNNMKKPDVATVLAKPASFLRGLALSALLALGAQAQADGVIPADATPLDKPLHISFCIFDLMGTGGDIYNYAKDLALEGRKWNVYADLKVYTDERVASEDFKAGQCDGLAVSTLRAKQFNSFIGSLDAVGAIPDYKSERLAIDIIMGNPKLQPLSISGPYQIVSVIPLGAAYVMVRDRSINSVEKAAGKKVAVLEWDKSEAQMVQQMGAQPVASDITNFAGKFNNGQVDIIAAPALAFRPLELYRGLGTTGAIFRFPLINLSGSVVINREHLLKQVPDLDARLDKVRAYALSRLGEAFHMIDLAEKSIDEKYWMDIAPADHERYVRLMREARLQLMHQGVYDPKMMGLLKKVRCKEDPGNAECTMMDE